jgi:hypothetical protein
MRHDHPTKAALMLLPAGIDLRLMQGQEFRRTELHRDDARGWALDEARGSPHVFRS